MALVGYLNVSGQHVGYGQPIVDQPPPPDPTPQPSPTIKWGSSAPQLGAETSRAAMLRVEKALGKLGVVRNFEPGSAQPKWPADLEPLAGRSVAYSFKAGGPAGVIAGTTDAPFRTFCRDAITYLNANPAAKVWWCFYHEPEDNMASGAFTSAQYKSAWARLINIQKTEFPHPRFKSVLILMKFTLEAGSGRTFTNYYPPAVDCLGWDGYAFVAATQPAGIIDPILAISAQYGKPWALAETGVNKLTHSGTALTSKLTALSTYIGTRSSDPEFVTYFDSPGDATNSWQISNDPALSKAWLDGIPTVTAPPVTPPGPVGTNVTFDSSAIEGGGFQNTIAISPFRDGTQRPVLIGADVSGPFRAPSIGAEWVSCAQGSVVGGSRVAAYMWSDSTAGEVFLLEDGGIHRSTDFGRTWVKRAMPANADGNGSIGLPPEHPRATGYLLDQEPAGPTVWAGTATQGLKSSIDDFATARATVLVGHPIRSIAVNPANPDEVFVAVNRGTSAQNGLWRVTAARSTAPVATKMASYPGVVATVVHGTATEKVGPEELLCVQDGTTVYLYVAAHESGMLRFNVTTGAWATINTGLPVGVATGNFRPVFRSIAVDPTNPAVLYAGCWHPNNNQAIFKSTTRGGSWQPITGPNPAIAPATGPIVVNYNMVGTSTRSFLADIPYHHFAEQQDWIPAMLAVDPDNTNRVLASGRGGAWFGTFDPTNTRWTWQPAVHGLMVTVCMTVTPDELTPGRAVLGNMDYKLLFTPDGGASAFQAPPSGPGSTGDATCTDMSQTTGPSRFYVGVSERGQNTGIGNVYSSLNPEAGQSSTWTDEGLTANGDVVGLAVGNNGSGTKVILAAVSNTAGTSVGGLWRKVGATWTQFRDPAAVPGGLTGTTAAHNQVNLRWRRATQTVYAHDNDGVWRSSDAGATWVLIYATTFAGYGNYDSLVVDPTDATKVYVSSGGTVKRINNANTAAAGGATVTTIFSPNADCIAINPDGSEMFVHRSDGTCWRSTTFRTAAGFVASNWVDQSSDLFRRLSKGIRSMAVLAGGIVMTADNGNGAFRGVRT